MQVLHLASAAPIATANVGAPPQVFGMPEAQMPAAGTLIDVESPVVVQGGGIYLAGGNISIGSPALPTTDPAQPGVASSSSGAIPSGSATAGTSGQSSGAVLSSSSASATGSGTGSVPNSNSGGGATTSGTGNVTTSNPTGGATYSNPGGSITNSNPATATNSNPSPAATNTSTAVPVPVLKFAGGLTVVIGQMTLVDNTAATTVGPTANGSGRGPILLIASAGMPVIGFNGAASSANPDAPSVVPAADSSGMGTVHSSASGANLNGNTIGNPASGTGVVDTHGALNAAQTAVPSQIGTLAFLNSSAASSSAPAASVEAVTNGGSQAGLSPVNQSLKATPSGQITNESASTPGSVVVSAGTPPAGDCVLTSDTAADSAISPGADSRASSSISDTAADSAISPGADSRASSSIIEGNPAGLLLPLHQIDPQGDPAAVGDRALGDDSSQAEAVTMSECILGESSVAEDASALVAAQSPAPAIMTITAFSAGTIAGAIVQGPWYPRLREFHES
jgi:hypothetical protein